MGMVECDHCGGSGWEIEYKTPCVKCFGAGYLTLTSKESAI